MKTLLLILTFIAFAVSSFAQSGEPAFTDDEILLLRAGKPLYQERLALQRAMSDQVTFQSEMDAVTAKIAQVQNVRDGWESQGNDGAVVVADLVLETLAADRDTLQELLDNPVNHTARIQQLGTVLNNFLDILLTIAPEGRTRAAYIEFVS